MDEITCIKAMQSEVTSNFVTWQDTELQNSCKLCRAFLRTQYLKNQYKAKLNQLQERSELAIRSLMTTFDVTKSNFDTLLEEKLENYRDMNSYKPYIELTNQHNRLLNENANLQLKIGQLNQLLEEASNEHAKEMFLLQNVIEKQERTIEILNDNIYYFIKKLKFKKNSHSVLKRVHFKRKIRSILSDNVGNIKFLTEKLESYDKNNVNCHVYIKNRECEQVEPMIPEIKSSEYLGHGATFSSNFVDCEEETPTSPSPNQYDDKNQEIECNHEIILSQEIDNRIRSDYEESYDKNLNNDDENCIASGIICHCDNYVECDPEGKLGDSTDAKTFHSDFQTLGAFPTNRQNNRTKYSIVCRQTDISYDDSCDKPKLINWSNGDAKNLSPQEIPEPQIVRKCRSSISTDTNDESGFCSCNNYKHCDDESFCACCNHLSTFLNEDYLNEQYTPSKASVSGKDCSENSVSESSSSSEETESSKELKHEQIQPRLNLMIQTVIDKFKTREKRIIQAEKPVPSKSEVNISEVKGSSAKQSPSPTRGETSFDLFKHKSMLQFEIEDISQPLSMDISRGKQHTVLQDLRPNEKNRESFENRPYSLTRKLPFKPLFKSMSKTRHQRSLHHKVRNPSLWLPTVDEAADSENEIFKNSLHDLKNPFIRWNLSKENKFNSFYQIPDRPHQPTPAPIIDSSSIKGCTNEQKKTPFLFNDRYEVAFDYETDVRSLLAFDHLETNPDQSERSDSALRFGEVPLRTESAPGRLQTLFDNLILYDKAGLI